MHMTKGKNKVLYDEIILKKREDIKKQKYASLEKGFYFEGKIIHFVEETMFDAFSIYIPDIMRVMPEEISRIKYPSEFRPDKIYTTLDLSVNIGFNMLWNNLEVKDVKKMSERMISAIKRSNSDIRFYGMNNVEEIGGCYFAFRSHAMDSDIYNMMLITPIGKDLLQSSFNCLYRDLDKWKKIINMIWQTIKKIEIENC